MLFARHQDVDLLRSRHHQGLLGSDLLISESLTNSYRPTYASVSLSALENNVSKLRELISPCLLAISVKANAYGHGLIPISQHLEKIGIDMLCVATVDEALELRSHSIGTPILLLSEPPIDAIGLCCLNDITFSVYTYEVIDTIAAFASTVRKAHVHVKIDTGMRRVGIEPQEALAFVRYISKQPSIHLEGVFTHFATADDPSDSGMSEQLKKFEDALDEIEIAGLTPPIVHAANTAAALRVPSSRFNMCRIGIGAYGIYPDPRCSDLIDLAPVMSLSTHISFIKHVCKGEYVSYGRSHMLKEDTKIATLPIGYGDGVPRNLGNAGGSVLIRSTLCPIVGNVTMDQMMVDIGDLQAEKGDRAILWEADSSRTISPVEWADRLSTIPYEVLCSLSERVERIYD